MVLLTKNRETIIPKMICDHSLENTAHWLRAAGYDVQVSFFRLTESQLLDQAIKQDRILLTNSANYGVDAEIDKRIIRFKTDNLYDQIKEISSSLAIDWLYKPISRCMVCNTKLVELNISNWIELSKETQSNCVASHGCLCCKRIYWAGEQINKMVGQLKMFKELDW